MSFKSKFNWFAKRNNGVWELFPADENRLTGAAWQEPEHKVEKPDAFQRWLLKPGMENGKVTFENKAALVLIGVVVFIVYGIKLLGAH